MASVPCSIPAERKGLFLVPTCRMASRGAQWRSNAPRSSRGGSGATRSHAQRAHFPFAVGSCRVGAREHGEDGEHPPFDRNEHLGTLDQEGRWPLLPPPARWMGRETRFKAILARFGHLAAPTPYQTALPPPEALKWGSGVSSYTPSIASLAVCATAAGV